jgi:hypothetical protein
MGHQSVADAVAGGGVTQVRGVDGSVRLGTPSVGPPPMPSSVTVLPPSSSVEGGDDGQSVTRLWTAGPVRQVDDVGGDVDIDR